MFFVAAMLTILSGLFYAASRHEIGSLGVAMCQYGSPFCDNPLLVLVAAGLAACWACSSACANVLFRRPCEFP
ncbi:hypothetical protein [Bradyrhizobium sp. RDI18]|uniref:hypothetical protein n=1 Tax=Bradyrhizobium sp. RDI18 TaxID=3367400 RepID=UPI0037115DEF